jgi:hypothetical protein
MKGGPFQLPMVLKSITKRRDDLTAWWWANASFRSIHQVGLGFFEGINPAAGRSWDHLVAAWLLTKFAPECCTGIENPGVQFLREGIPAEVIDKVIGKKIHEDDCRTLAIAQGLGFTDDEALKLLFAFTTKRFERNGGEVFELHALLHSLYSNEYGVQQIWDWGSLALDVTHETGLEFFEGGGTLLARNPPVEIFAARRINGQRRRANTKLAVTESDQPEFSKYARSQECGVVIQSNDSNGTQIHTNQRLEIDLDEVVQILRAKEAEVQHRTIPSDPKLLSATGTLAEVPEWYYPDHKGAIYNGTQNKSAPPSRLTLVQIVDSVTIGLDQRRFANSLLPRRNMFLDEALALSVGKLATTPLSKNSLRRHASESTTTPAILTHSKPRQHHRRGVFFPI